MSESAPSPPASAQDVKRATVIVLVAIAIATLLIVLAIRNSSPHEKCRFLLDRVTSGNGTEAEFDEWDQLDCGSMDI